VAVLGLEFPHVLVRVLHVVVAHLVQDLLQVRDRLPCALGQILDVVILKNGNLGVTLAQDRVTLGPMS
jgi:hypothetical protein